MIQTWIADVTPLLDNQTYEKYYAGLPRWRKEKADKEHHREDQARSVGVWILYRRMRETYGISEREVYNLSHSGRYALCSVRTCGTLEKSGHTSRLAVDSTVKLGCDVEMIGDFRPGIAKRFFCPAEEAYIQKQNGPKLKAEAFYRYWVLKESFIKATRQGLRMDLRSFEIHIEDGQAMLIRQPEDYPERYYYREYQAEAGDAKIAVCSTDPEFGDMQTVNLFCG